MNLKQNLAKCLDWGPRTMANPKGNRLYDLIHYIEFLLLKRLLKRHVELEMDQWERWEFKTKYDSAYVTISTVSDGYNYTKLDCECNNQCKCFFLTVKKILKRR